MRKEIARTMMLPESNLFENRNRIFAGILMLLSSIIGWWTWVLFVSPADKDMAFGNWMRVFDKGYVNPIQWWGLALTLVISMLAFWKSSWIIPVDEGA